MLTNKDVLICKEKIIKCLTEDFTRNQAIFDKEDGFAIWSQTDLTMVVDKVIKGLKFAQEEISLRENVVQGTKGLGTNPNPATKRKRKKKIENESFENLLQDISIGQPIVATSEQAEASQKYNEHLSSKSHPPFLDIKV